MFTTTYKLLIYKKGIGEIFNIMSPKEAAQPWQCISTTSPLDTFTVTDT